MSVQVGAEWSRLAARGRRSAIARREELEFYFFVLPWLVGFVLFSAGPIIASFFISLTEWSMLRAPRWVWLQNYHTIVSNDPLFSKTLFNTLYYVLVSVPMGNALALFTAILLNQHGVVGKAFFRTCFYVPSLVTGVSLAVLWSWLLNPEFGLLNHALSFLGIQPVAWLYNTRTAMPAMIFMSLWGIGGTVVIYLAGLQGIPEHYYEAAELDGAGVFARFRHVTLPMISPTIFFCLIMGVIGSFQTFTQFFVMTTGGPANATLVYVLYLYRQAFEYFRMGYAASLAWILFIVILAATAVQFWGAKRWVYYEAALR
ncbi:MAG: carbohydrate ABC transporter permease [Anaerolineae bacterium]